MENQDYLITVFDVLIFSHLGLFCMTTCAFCEQMIWAKLITFSFATLWLFIVSLSQHFWYLDPIPQECQLLLHVHLHSQQTTAWHAYCHNTSPQSMTCS